MLASLASAGCSVFGAHTVELARYDVIESAGAIEIRAYPEQIVARTAMAGGSNAAFGRLFDYISGANAGEAKIAMTAPVVMGAPVAIAMTAPVVSDGETMAFLAPASYTLESMPRPTDPAVEIVAMPARTAAAITFSGFLSRESARAEEQHLRAWLERSAWRANGPAARAGYNPPWTLPFLRRNEVIIPVEPREPGGQASGSGVTAR